MPFDPDQATRPKVPSFKFGAIGDGFKMTITDVSDDVEMTDNESGDKNTNLVLVGTIESAKGGDREDADSPTTDTPAGEQRSVWLLYRTNGMSKASPLTQACAQALKEAGAREFQVGGSLAVQHNELGQKPKNPAYRRARLYKAQYTPPAAGFAAAAASSNDDDFSPF